MKLVLQSLVLILSFVLIFIWQNTPLSAFTIPLLGILIVLYFVLSARKIGLPAGRQGKGFLTIFLLNTLIFLLIFSTDSINSPLFFLLYFLGFGVAFVFEPPVTFVFVLGAILIFVPDALIKGDVITNFLKVGSILLISPLAFFFGKEYRKESEGEEKIEALKERTKDSADTISKDLEKVIKNEKQNLKSEDVEKLNEVLEETEDLRQEAKEN